MNENSIVGQLLLNRKANIHLNVAKYDNFFYVYILEEDNAILQFLLNKKADIEMTGRYYKIILNLLY